MHHNPWYQPETKAYLGVYKQLIRKSNKKWESITYYNVLFRLQRHDSRCRCVLATDRKQNKTGQQPQAWTRSIEDDWFEMEARSLHWSGFYLHAAWLFCEVCLGPKWKADCAPFRESVATKLDWPSTASFKPLAIADVGGWTRCYRLRIRIHPHIGQRHRSLNLNEAQEQRNFTRLSGRFHGWCRFLQSGYLKR